MVQRKEAGFTVVELMIGLLIGLLVLGGIFSVYISTLKSSGSTLKSSKLNQEMATIMTIMADDIRRAGYSGAGPEVSVLDNPFSKAGETALEVHSLSGTYSNAGVQGSGSCIVYAYDLNKDGALSIANPAEVFGFRWDGPGSAIKMRTGVSAAANINDCNADSANWFEMTDNNFITISGLTFALTNSSCVNITEPNRMVEGTGATPDTALAAGATENFNERDCYNFPNFSPDTGEMTVEIREVIITLEGALADDPDVTLTMTQSVEVRNNLIRITP